MKGFLSEVLVLFCDDGACQDPGHGVVGEPALSLHHQDVPRPEEESGGDRGQAGVSYQEYGRLAQADGEQRG